MTKKIPKKLMKPMVTKEQWLKFTEVLYEQRHPELIEKRVRRETAKQIFAELESIKDEYGNSILDTLYGKGKQYAKLKKKYKVY